jgi:NTE family protein
MTHSEHDSHTALVLGGGGSTGNAWLIGVLAGLFDAGLDVTTADLTIGTSAGATAAAQITAASPPRLLANILDAVPPSRHVASSPLQTRVSPVANHMDATAAIIGAAADAGDMRRRMGAAALERDAASDGSVSTQWRATVAARLPGSAWPHRQLFITAVDARTGEGVVFDGQSGVDLVDAVAASTSGGPHPYRIGDGRYIDGGYRSNAENADLAAGFARVLVLSPFGGRSRTPVEWGMHLASQVGDLRAGGSRVETIFPERSAAHMFGVNGMDLSLRPPAARAGYEQGRSRADRLADLWS